MSPSSKPFFQIALIGMVLTSGLGLLACLHLDQPFQVPGFASIHLTQLRPLHTLFALTTAFAGIYALLHAITSQVAPQNSPKSGRLQLLCLLAFLLAAATSLVAGNGSGREYFSWQPEISLPLFLSLLLLARQLLHHRHALSNRSPEGFWLIATGSSFLLLSTVESCLWLLPYVGLNPVADLTTQWHAIDALFAGINLSLYGSSLYFLDSKARPLRATSLFGIALFSLLFTFGHHHYASPQPTWLKVLALLASLLAVSSFIRHSLAYFRQSRNRQATPGNLHSQLIRSIQLWTLVSLLSGILYAIPQLNLYIHGTHLVLIHAMGSMIGICLIIYLGAFKSTRALHPKTEAQGRRQLRLLNASLAGLWLVLGSGGLYKGIARLSQDYLEFAPTLRWMNLGFLLCGSALFAGVTLLSVNALRQQRYAIRHRHAQESKAPVAAR